MRHLFIGGRWDGQVHDLAAEFGVTGERRRAGVIVPTSKRDDPVMTTMLYYPRRYSWATERGGVTIEVMADSISEPLGGRLLLHLFRLAGLDVTWEPDPTDPGGGE